MVKVDALVDLFFKDLPWGQRYDIYHMGIMTGNMTSFLEHNIEWIGHFHSAGIPGRHELFNGETNYPFLVDRIEKAAYNGYFGLEYMPLLPCPETLVKTMKYLSGEKI